MGAVVLLKSDRQVGAVVELKGMECEGMKHCPL